ncbi:hypothetical protein HYT52_04060 [Candidatus Woesearchaeota archaeon]|nr:hypothetical protein [Candidatus Woesearchaeota archaeon]
MDKTELLLRYGFIKESAKSKYNYNSKIKEWAPKSGKFEASDADEEERQMTFHQVHGSSPTGFERTGFPSPSKTYWLSLEVYDLSLEGPYFWMLEYLRQNFSKVLKVEDSFAAAENSAFFGITQQRLGGQQDKVSQFLATTGKMIKELFQMVRELRVIDERLAYYNEAEAESKKPMDKRGKSSEITLKGIFIDLVQGGGKSAASVYGMSRELEFITLPDLFFDAPPLSSSEELEKYIEGLRKNFNESVLRVLIRHLRQFLEWRRRTQIEHRNRRQFMLSYLKQHFEIINMYLAWIKPYLRHVEKLTMKEKNMSMPEIVSAFEGSMLDVEILAMREIKVAGDIKGYESVLATFNYRTRPEMKVVQEGYQRGPVHIGKLEMNLRCYNWLKEDVDNYVKLKEKESFMLMGDVSASVQEAMEALGTELSKYLAEAKGQVSKLEDEAKTEGQEVKRGFFSDIFPSKPKAHGAEKKLSKKEQTELDKKISDFKKSKKGHNVSHAWNGYHTFKKHFNLISW